MSNKISPEVHSLAVQYKKCLNEKDKKKFFKSLDKKVYGIFQEFLNQKPTDEENRFLCDLAKFHKSTHSIPVFIMIQAKILSLEECFEEEKPPELFVQEILHPAFAWGDKETLQRVQNHLVRKDLGFKIENPDPHHFVLKLTKLNDPKLIKALKNVFEKIHVKVDEKTNYQDESSPHVRDIVNVVSNLGEKVTSLNLKTVQGVKPPSQRLITEMIQKTKNLKTLETNTPLDENWIKTMKNQIPSLKTIKSTPPASPPPAPPPKKSRELPPAPVSMPPPLASASSSVSTHPQPPTDDPFHDMMVRSAIAIEDSMTKMNYFGVKATRFYSEVKPVFELETIGENYHYYADPRGDGNCGVIALIHILFEQMTKDEKIAGKLRSQWNDTAKWIFEKMGKDSSLETSLNEVLEEIIKRIKSGQNPQQIFHEVLSNADHYGNFVFMLRMICYKEGLNKKNISQENIKEIGEFGCWITQKNMEFMANVLGIKVSFFEPSTMVEETGEIWPDVIRGGTPESDFGIFLDVDHFYVVKKNDGKIEEQLLKKFENEEKDARKKQVSILNMNVKIDAKRQESNEKRSVFNYGSPTVPPVLKEHGSVIRIKETASVDPDEGVLALAYAFKEYLEKNPHKKAEYKRTFNNTIKWLNDIISSQEEAITSQQENIKKFIKKSETTLYQLLNTNFTNFSSALNAANGFTIEKNFITALRMHCYKKACEDEFFNPEARDRIGKCDQPLSIEDLKLMADLLDIPVAILDNQSIENHTNSIQAPMVIWQENNKAPYYFFQK